MIERTIRFRPPWPCLSGSPPNYANDEIRLWNEITECYREFVTDNKRLHLEVDWEQYVSGIASEAMRTQFEAGGFTVSRSRNDDPNRLIECRVRIETSKQLTDDTVIRIIENRLRRLQHEIFLALNLSLPGTCLSWESGISSDHAIASMMEMAINAHSMLTPWDFFDAYVRSLEMRWPTIGRLPLKSVAHWLETTDVRSGDVFESGIQRCLMAMLQRCRNGLNKSEATLWSAVALESLYPTDKNCRAYSQIWNRARTILGNPEDDELVRNERALRLFYDRRNEILHRTSHVRRPSRGARPFGDSIELAVFAIVISTLQFLIAHRLNAMPPVAAME